MTKLTCITWDGAYNIIREYIDSWEKHIINNFFIVKKKSYFDLKYKELPLDSDIFLFIQFVPKNIFKHIKKIKQKCVVLNIEQNSRSSVIKMMLRHKNNNIKVLDYSKIGSELTGGLYLPYCYNPTEINMLKKYNGYDYDVMMCNLKPGRRNNIYELLKKNNNLKVSFMKGWGEKRDCNIMKGKVFVNVHYNKVYRSYESIRCDRILYAGNIVITEESNDIPEDLAPLLVVVPYEQIINKVIEIIDNFDEYYKNYKIKFNKHIKNIIINRNLIAKSVGNNIKNIKINSNNKTVKKNNKTEIK